MFNEKHYVPILKWKRGERVALEKLDPHSKGSLTPLIEIVPVTYDFKNDCPKETIDEHLGDFCEQLNSSWGFERPVFIDLDYIDFEERMQDGRHPLKFIFDGLRNNGLSGIPVTGSGRDAAYQAEVKNINQIDGRGICIRLKDDDFIGTDQVLQSLLSLFNVTEEEIDIVVDIGEINPDGQRSALVTAIAVINAITNVNAYRTLTLTGSSFPSNLSKFVSTGTIGSVPRSEWINWKSIYANKARISRVPTFGDYTINNPDLIEMDPRLMQMAAGIRYTGDNDFFIFRGISIRKAGSGGWGQAQLLCQQIISHSCFSGSAFSWGDGYIDDCANGNASTGTAETWRRVGTNHHLTLVANELANFSWT